MKLHRFYIGEVQRENDLLHIVDVDLLHQWKNVFRMKPNDQVLLFNNERREYLCRLLSLEKKVASLSIDSEQVGRMANRNITLCAALVKKDNFDLILQKAVELGATTIIPLISERSEKKGLNMKRAAKIAIEASEQCGRVDIPQITEPLSLSNTLGGLSKDAYVIGFEPTGDSFNANEFAHKNIALFIGPEGGWTPHEIDLLHQHGKVMQLPTFILRAETAAIAALSLANLLV